MGFGLKGFGTSDTTRARDAVTEHVRKNEPVTAKELAAADPNVVLDANGKVKLPETIANMRRDDFGRPSAEPPRGSPAERDHFNFRYFAERQGATGFVGVPEGVDVRSAARLLSLEQAVPAAPTPLEKLSWKDFVAELKARTPEARRAALDEFDAAMGQLESLKQDLPPGDPASKQLSKRLDDLFSRQQLVLQALDSPRVLDQAVDP